MNDLDDQLDRTGSNLSLMTPLSDITTRGRTLRNGRRVRRGSIAATAAVALVGGALAITTGSGTDVAPETTLVSAGWSTSLKGLPIATSDEYTTLCQTAGDAGYGLTPEERVAAADVFDGTPVASTELAGSTGPVSVLIFHASGMFASCLLDLDENGTPVVAGMQALPLVGDAGHDVTPTSSYLTSNGSYGDGNFQLSMGITSPEVDAVRITFGGAQISATVEGGVFAAVLPDPTAELARSATVEAYDADGNQLEQVPLLTP